MINENRYSTPNDEIEMEIALRTSIDEWIRDIQWAGDKSRATIRLLAELLLDPQSSLSTSYHIDTVLTQYSIHQKDISDTEDRRNIIDEAAKSLLFLTIGNHGMANDDRGQHLINYALECIQKQLLEPNLTWDSDE